MHIKPAALRTGKTGKEEIEKRAEAEEKLKVDIPMPTAPLGLSENGKELYYEIIELLPSGLLSAGDTYTIGVVADALDRMQTAQKVLNETGLFTSNMGERDASRVYERYAKIFDKFSAKIGLSPKDRAQLAVLNVKEQDEKEDPLLKALREE